MCKQCEITTQARISATEKLTYFRACAAKAPTVVVSKCEIAGNGSGVFALSLAAESALPAADTEDTGAECETDSCANGIDNGSVDVDVDVDACGCSSTSTRIVSPKPSVWGTDIDLVLRTDGGLASAMGVGGEVIDG